MGLRHHADIRARVDGSMRARQGHGLGKRVGARGKDYGVTRGSVGHLDDVLDGACTGAGRDGVGTCEGRYCRA